MSGESQEGNLVKLFKKKSLLCTIKIIGGGFPWIYGEILFKNPDFDFVKPLFDLLNQLKKEKKETIDFVNKIKKLNLVLIPETGNKKAMRDFLIEIVDDKVAFR